VTDDRSKNLDALLASLDEPAQLLPRRKPGYAGRRRALPCDGQNVPEGIGMEPSHCSKVGGQGFALARLKLQEEVVHGLLDELLCGVVFLGGALLVRRFAVTAERRIFPVRRGGGGCAAGCVKHDVCSPVAAREGRSLKEGVCLNPNFFV